MPGRILKIPSSIWDAMLEHVEACLPEEACGLLGGVGGQVRSIVKVTNAERSPVRYRMDPLEQVQAFLALDEEGLELVGIYHSHPLGPGGPSATDLAENAYPEAVYLIWSPGGRGWRCRAFDLSAGRPRAVTLVRTEG